MNILSQAFDIVKVFLARNTFPVIKKAHFDGHSIICVGPLEVVCLPSTYDLRFLNCVGPGKAFLAMTRFQKLVTLARQLLIRLRGGRHVEMLQGLLVSTCNLVYLGSE